ncbi:hypothetical protein AAC387_Pa01g4171 [Persea americana]
MDGEEEVPVTPAGRFFLQPDVEAIINCVVGLKLPIDIESTKAEICKTLLNHPRFCSILVKDKRGVECWRRTHVDIDQHMIFPSQFQGNDGNEEKVDEDDGESVNRYLAELAVSSPLDLKKPPWEIHVLKSRRCCVLRLHHALGDGTSLMSLFLASCRRVDEPDLLPTLPTGKSTNTSRARPGLAERVWEWTAVVCLTVVYVVEFVLRSLWVRDGETAISGGAGVEMWPRKVATARFDLQDMKMVKKAVNGTINDVLFGIISYGLAKYLKFRSSRELEGLLRITGLALVNTRQLPGLQDPSNMMKKGSKSRWGNQMGYIVLPIYLGKVEDPLKYLRRAKAMLDRKKSSLEARFSYWMGSLVMSLLGPKIATILNYRIIANTTFTISNLVGPQEEIMFAGNPIAYLRTTSTSLPHALTMHMVSYKGKADMQILVAKDIIPDPHILAKCFQDALHEMKDVATNMVHEGSAT